MYLLECPAEKEIGRNKVHKHLCRVMEIHRHMDARTTDTGP